MYLAILTLHFRLPGSRSLKEKRRRLNGLRERFGRQPGIAVCESGLQGSQREAEWSFVALASSRAGVEKLLATVEQHSLDNIDAVIVGRNLEFL